MKACLKRSVCQVLGQVHLSVLVDTVHRVLIKGSIVNVRADGAGWLLGYWEFYAALSTLVEEQDTFGHTLVQEGVRQMCDSCTQNDITRTHTTQAKRNGL